MEHDAGVRTTCFISPIFPGITDPEEIIRRTMDQCNLVWLENLNLRDAYKGVIMKISLCGDDCFKCPRYLAKSDEELQRVAELWYRAGYRNHVVSNDEIRCSGCYPGKQCGYGLTECTNAHGVEKCNQCPEFQCDKLREMLRRSACSQEQCKEVCSPAEYAKLKAAFFNKENNLRK